MAFNHDTRAIEHYNQAQENFFNSDESEGIVEGAWVLCKPFRSFEGGFKYSDVTTSGKTRPFGQVCQIVKIKDGSGSTGVYSIVVADRTGEKFDMPFFAVELTQVRSIVEDRVLRSPQFPTETPQPQARPETMEAPTQMEDSRVTGEVRLSNGRVLPIQAVLVVDNERYTKDDIKRRHDSLTNDSWSTARVGNSYVPKADLARILAQMGN